jgi:hypothetical protein
MPHLGTTMKPQLTNVSAWAIASVVLGASVAYPQSPNSASGNRQRPAGQPVREVFVPNQDLSLSDGTGAPLG